jgi:hypothetical protein
MFPHYHGNIEDPYVMFNDNQEKREKTMKVLGNKVKNNVIAYIDCKITSTQKTLIKKLE